MVSEKSLAIAGLFCYNVKIKLPGMLFFLEKISDQAGIY